MHIDRTLILGLGNPILGDDGVGWRIAEAVSVQLFGSAVHPGGPRDPVEIDRLASGGLTLMERLIGYDQAILIDAIDWPGATPGKISCFPLQDLPVYAHGHLDSAHDATLQTALAAGQTLGAHLPHTITIVAIQAQNPYSFSEELTPPVAAAVPLAVGMIMDLIGGYSI